VCALKGGNVAPVTAESHSVLVRAYLKYADALVLDDTNAACHFHVGRLLVAQGDYDGAVARLETALNWNSQHQLARSVCVGVISYCSLQSFCMQNTGSRCQFYLLLLIIIKKRYFLPHLQQAGTARHYRVNKYFCRHL